VPLRHLARLLRGRPGDATIVELMTTSADATATEIGCKTWLFSQNGYKSEV
jgi:hypothetical protein